MADLAAWLERPRIANCGFRDRKENISTADEHFVESWVCPHLNQCHLMSITEKGIGVAKNRLQYAAFSMPWPLGK